MSNDNQKALIVVDVQNDFCPGGSLAVADGYQVVAPLNQLIKEFLDRGEPVYKTRDWHPAQTKHFQVYGGIWPVHCVQGTRGAEFHPDLSTDPRVTIISKGFDEKADGYSGFDGTNLAELLREEGVKEVWVGGLATDYCVKHTVLDALKEGFEVKALADAMRAVNVNREDGTKARASQRMRKDHGTATTAPDAPSAAWEAWYGRGADTALQVVTPHQVATRTSAR